MPNTIAPKVLPTNSTSAATDQTTDVEEAAIPGQGAHQPNDLASSQTPPTPPKNRITRLEYMQLINQHDAACNALTAGTAEVAEKPQAEQDKRILPLLNAYIKTAHALPFITPDKRQKLAHAHYNRACIKTENSNTHGPSAKFTQEKINYNQRGNELINCTSETNRKKYSIALRNAQSSYFEALENLFNDDLMILEDFQQGFAMNPADDYILSALPSQLIRLIGYKSILSTEHPDTFCTDETLMQVIGDSAHTLLEQKNLMHNAKNIFLNNVKILMGPHAQKMRPVLENLLTICLDLVAFTIDIQMPQPGRNHSHEKIQQAERRVNTTLRHYAELAPLIDEWLQIYPAVKGRDELHVGDFVSVLAPSGLHVPAQIQENGRATVSNKNQVLSFEQDEGGNFCLVDSEEDDSEIEEIDTALDNTEKHLLSKLAREAEKAEKLLNQSHESQLDQSTACKKGLNDPDLIMFAYGMRAEKYNKLAERMNRLSARLEKICTASDTPEDKRLELSNLADRLKDQATTLLTTAQELTSPKTRYSLIKAYARPQAAQIAELFDAGEIKEVSRITQLKSEPPELLFEIKIQPKPDAEGMPDPPPIYLHLHINESITIRSIYEGVAQDPTATHQKFTAIHFKSAAGRRHGKQWVQSQPAGGHYSQKPVHRSPASPELLKTVIDFSNRPTK